MRILVTGGAGLLGSALVPELRSRGHEVVAPPPSDLDLTADAAAIGAFVAEAAPEAVVNLAAFTDVDGAESRPEEAFAVNRDGAGKLAEAAAAAGARLVHMSSDYVFDGSAARPIPVDAPVRPVGVYGRSKAEGEAAVRRAGGDYLIVRSSWIYGPHGRNFVDAVLARARSGSALRVVSDQRGRPTWTPSLARGLATLLAAGSRGVVHLADDGDATWYELAVEALRLAGVDAPVEPVSTEAWGAAAPRPRYSVLDLDATRSLVGPIPHWKDSLTRHLAAGR